MLTVNIIFFIYLLIMAAGLFYKRYKMRQKESALYAIEGELDKTLTTLKSIAKEKKETKNFSEDSMADPGMLSTIITVIVHKYGSIRLKIDDFTAVPDGEYVSVYVDVDEQNIILSTDKSLAAKDPLSMVSFSNSDDNTFH
jgi:hypothetical protein